MEMARHTWAVKRAFKIPVPVKRPHRELHRVTVREISGTRLRIGPIEAIDGMPVVDVKPVLVDCVDAARRRQSIL
jgi:tRNA (Thr-GGU) A37 N-methylase